MSDPDHDVVVIGGGQAGLAVAYYLRRAGLDFVVLDAEGRPGGAWRHTWDSLRLFSPAGYSSLPGWPMPSSQTKGFPTRDEVVDYLSRYERRYGFPIERPCEVRAVERDGERLRLRLKDQRSLTARAVVSATGTWGAPYTSAGRDPGLVARPSTRLVRLVTKLLLDQFAVVVRGRQCPGHALGFDISDTTRPAAAEGVPDLQRPHETEPGGADTLDRLMVRSADRIEQPFAAARDAGVHGSVVGGEVGGERRANAGGQPVEVGVPIGALHDRFDLGAVLVVVAQRRERHLRLARFAVPQDQEPGGGHALGQNLAAQGCGRHRQKTCVQRRQRGLACTGHDVTEENPNGTAPGVVARS